MRIFHSFLPSFLATSFPTDFPCTFEFWLAYDLGDPLLDSPQVTLSPSPYTLKRMHRTVCAAIPRAHPAHARPNAYMRSCSLPCK